LQELNSRLPAISTIRKAKRKYNDKKKTIEKKLTFIGCRNAFSSTAAEDFTAFFKLK